MTSAPPLVSVVVATNRSGPFLREALDSVIAQTYPAVELIIVDDASPVADEIAGLAAHAGATLRRLSPSGPSVARNSGVARATGELLAFLDDDDRWDRDRLAMAVDALRAEPSAVLAYCGMRTIDAAGHTLVEADQTAVHGRFDVARRATGIILPNIVVRAEAFRTVGGFHSRIRFAEDLDLILRLAECGPFAFVPRTLVDYRAHAGNTTRRHRVVFAGIGQVLALHRWAALERGDRALVDALDESRLKNDRYAWWSAWRAVQALPGRRRAAAAISELWWALRVAPRGLSGLGRSLGRAMNRPKP
ncbi:hypothetical protein GCM10022240_00240 [Microbacterium kribbense]|uniref:Glycosyltransferase 2-like domain-containing protein n=1 Tax=Microbacterium kribbense TaxID=433645 RepID=A0ABP7FYA7_9MICO